MLRPGLLAAMVLMGACQRPTPAWPPADASVECISLLGAPLRATPPAERRATLEADLAAARAALAAAPDDADPLIWVGRRLGYLWRMREAMAVYTDGVCRFPNDARFLRHRGHRYISVRQFDLAIADLALAANLTEDRADLIEPDGVPNSANQPLTSLKFNIWYHLGVAHYLKGDFESAARAFQTAGRLGGGHDDNAVAVADWSWMSLRRLGRPDDAARVLANVPPVPVIIENRAYELRVRMYRGVMSPEALLATVRGQETDDVTLAYGVGNFYQCGGDTEMAKHIFGHITTGPNWPAFAFNAAEADLARMRSRHPVKRPP